VPAAPAACWIASQLGKRVLVVDRLPHVAGSASDQHDAHGVLVHGHGPHVFHTNADAVWTYLSGTVVFAGRLTDCAYYNMDQAVARALNVFERELVS
jgi:UDP-galactopyranose mutase